MGLIGCLLFGWNLKKQVNVCRDPKDNHILALAHEADANFIVTGDKDLLVLENYKETKIVTPADFLTGKLWK